MQYQYVMALISQDVFGVENELASSVPKMHAPFTSQLCLQKAITL